MDQERHIWETEDVGLVLERLRGEGKEYEILDRKMQLKGWGSSLGGSGSGT